MPAARTFAGQDEESRRVRWWVPVLAIAFCGYYALLVYCDLTRPEPFGFVGAITGSGLRVDAVQPDSPAAEAGLRTGDVILQANGRRIGHRLDWRLACVNLRTGRPFVLSVRQHDDRREITLVPGLAGAAYWAGTPGVTLALSRAVQLVALVFAIVVSIRRPDDGSARAGAWVLASIATFSIDWPYQIAAVWRELPVAAGAALWIPFASSVALPAIVFTFFATFPQPVIRARWIAAAWVPMLAITGLVIASAWRTVYEPLRPAQIFDWSALHGAAIGAYTVAAIAVLAVGYHRLTGITERRRVRILAVGSAIGLGSALPATAFYWLRPPATEAYAIFASPLVAIGTLLGLLVPLSFAYAILRHRLFNVGFLVRAGLQHALARRLLVSLAPAALVLLAVDLWGHRDLPTGEALRAHDWAYIALAALAVVARLRRDRWLDGLDRRFFRERYQAERLLRSLGEDIRAASSFEAVASSTVAKIEAALHPRIVAILARHTGEDAYQAVASAPVATAIDPLPSASRMAALLHLLESPLRVDAALIRGLPAEDMDWLRRTRADLLVPIRRGRDGADAVLLLGPKRSQEPYSIGDEDLLMAIALNLGSLPEHVAAERGAGRFAECPACGTCCDAGVDRCALDGAALAVQPFPRLLAGRYRLDRRIGRGGMGTVYEAFDTALDRRVAAKLLREDVVDVLGGSADRFAAEARLAAALVHPNVVTIHDIGSTGGGRPFLVMELLHGTTLRDELCRAGRLPPDRVRRVLAGVCAAVDTAHRRNIIHRDLKPENVYLCRGDSAETIKVLDFGLAKPLDSRGEPRLTRPGVVGGTPAYMSPEHRRGEDPSPDWDLWAVAVIAFEMITGTPPPSSGGAPPGARDLPPRLREVFDRALSPDPIERPESASELLHALEAAMEAGNECQA